ncbi:MAG: hypothetical protein A2W52_04865 [Candidatus Taylorbacteria bacterium RIFCSPHIGHO2_02_49_25]|uniref:Uncharacterized protein n=1 Tax=Candidatus Taylorbacteria bacterium RIFCSPHIGHO2_02_49_25 TaxID=1802305 RepID=A0A1G2MF91_9BACT|nr:MAG: hypothetical protein UY62_C0060G0003 [Parcubacteria group bacterium GW2011_GWF2_50_9]OHA21721.1 MAG: hypothetical protein A2759_02315 [Candidatus Taylorbacteria bacterium RIFCSPHIGHO2_01_FULL_49_60]OHA22374.1 MAG: hypothetical protein A2W52_04865 [Candidatus Taylorbacteria bacterium RIFCSPHIGHO2_02_49_25]OHA35854.1 MAG: hypothetical protein A2W65_03625 [Candidatus Taylorbacteria bacterium RIFCSPLOWO2_02_50_13]OHA37174.1 MAG: hypothetical protein A3B27_02695 [Candidatus Taylorbacteria ba
MTQEYRRVFWRIITDALLIAAVFILPWWAVLLSGAIFFFLFEYFLEMLFAALLLDLLYGVPLSRYGGFAFVVSLISVSLYIVLSALKRRMRWYALRQ